MSLLVASLVAVLAVWMLACAWTGFHFNIKRFIAVLIIGLGLNMIWMMGWLNAHPFEINALIAQASAVLYALCAFGAGWFAGRIHRAWVASRVDQSDV
ncbi:hypothetical protein [Sulfitobacter mediterraneus]|uniref:hypothetical protein n=1 Tax=Sulfitobacter mediterraneus TaxID=83219 RepID=UPI000EA3EF82|nr:hypothetical protein [Sulfitobacter mediterraneus]UWR12752.1 hypothetical protein K3753_07845 [Sulfitobacter mediterraneus]